MYCAASGFFLSLEQHSEGAQQAEVYNVKTQMPSILSPLVLHTVFTFSIAFFISQYLSSLLNLIPI